MKRFLLTIVLLLLALPVSAQQQIEYNLVPTDQRTRMRNPDGSCVQCSIAIAGVHHNIPSAEFLLVDSEYGRKVRGGSYPSRVEGYCRERKIDIWNIEGSQSMQWIEWALSTGRYVALTFGRAHMQTAVGMSADRQTFFVVDNNSPQRVDTYTRDRFLQLHRTHGGGWCVILKGPVPAPWQAPPFTNWWE
jgi:hypothetical protein